jgi:Tol biopolymer transport system component/predicted Ser/Thr protein kinase
MPITGGTRFGPYEIITRLGAGGMGEVYKARDIRLGRTIAIKVLAPALATDPVARQRLEREARAVSKLSHPHICPLFDIGHQDGTDFLVMEYLDGETLASRLARGRLAPDDALRYAMQITDALAAAHRAGIVHRDLKPGNVMLTKDGAMLLDFGLARAREESITTDGEAVTLSEPLTTEGAIVGTLRYMAPEQLAGHPSDFRTDVFALGLVLSELYSDSPSHNRLPPHVARRAATLAGQVPQHIRWVVECCLVEDPEARWQHAGDVFIALRTANSPGVPAPTRAHPLANWQVLAMLAIFAGIAGLTGAVLARRGATSAAAAPVEFALPMESDVLSRPAVSPDGRAIAFIASGEGTPDVRVRSLETGRVTAVPGSQGAEFVFWSSDGREVGYAAGGKLRRSRLPNGPPQTITVTNGAAFGATWSGDTVLFAGAGGKGIFRASAHGGTPAALTTIDPAKRETSHRFPLFLPDGHHYLFLVRSEDERASGLYVADLNEPTRQRAAANVDSSFAYASGHLLFGREGSLWAQAFDPERVRVTGDPSPMAHPVFVTPAGRWAQVGASASTVAYATGDFTYPSVLRWLSRDGRDLGTIGPVRPNWNPQLSPDGRQLAVARNDDTGTQSLIWLTDLKRSLETNFTPGGGINGHPVWAPDGAHLAYAANVGGYWVLQVKGVRDAVSRQVLPSDHVSRHPQAWASDDALVYQEQGVNGLDLWQTRLSTPSSRTLLVGGPGDQIHAAVSPDRRWLAYVSNETGRYEVYVKPYDGQDRWQVSAGGGVQPRWRADTRELYFLRPEGALCAVAVASGTQFEAGPPAVLWRATLWDITNGAYWHYSASADGSRFLVNTVMERAAPLFHVVVNWRPK